MASMADATLNVNFIVWKRRTWVDEWHWIAQWAYIYSCALFLAVTMGVDQSDYVAGYKYRTQLFHPLTTCGSPNAENVTRLCIQYFHICIPVKRWEFVDFTLCCPYFVVVTINWQSYRLNGVQKYEIDRLDVLKGVRMQFDGLTSCEYFVRLAKRRQRGSNHGEYGTSTHKWFFWLPHNIQPSQNEVRWAPVLLTLYVAFIATCFCSVFACCLTSKGQ